MLQSISTSTVSTCFNANFRDIQAPTTVQLPCPWRVQLFSSAPASGPTKVCRGLQQRSKEYCWLKQPAATPTGGCETSGEASFFNVMSHAAKFKSCSLRQCFFMRDSMHEKYEPSLSLVRLYLCSLGYRTIAAHGSWKVTPTLCCAQSLWGLHCPWPFQAMQTLALQVCNKGKTFWKWSSGIWKGLSENGSKTLASPLAKWCPRNKAIKSLLAKWNSLVLDCVRAKIEETGTWKLCTKSGISAYAYIPQEANHLTCQLFVRYDFWMRCTNHSTASWQHAWKMTTTPVPSLLLFLSLSFHPPKCLLYCQSFCKPRLRCWQTELAQIQVPQQASTIRDSHGLNTFVQCMSNR